MRKMFLICFDISSDKKRRKVVKQLESKATRVQKSVFEAWLTDKQLIELKTVCEKIIDHSTDSIRYYFLCQNCASLVKVSGYGIYTQREDIIVI